MKWNKKPFSPALTVAFGIALAYVAYFLSRAVFLAVNWSYFSGNLTASRLWEMWRGGVMFDTSAIMYTNVLWILLVLFPLHLKERRLYHQICRWIFVVVNSVAVVMNLCDTVYFQYTSRRTTSTVFSEFSQDNNLMAVFGHEIVAHWYLVLIGIAMIYGLWKGMAWLSQRLAAGGKMPRASYYCVQVVALAVAGVCVVGGIRGGLAHSVRPITVSNANQYIDRPIEAAIVLNTPFSILRTIGKNVFEVPNYFATEAEMEAVYSPVQQVAVPSAASTPPKNVVVMILESFGKEYIGSLNPEIEGYKGYTPFLDSLIAKSLTWKYSFANGRKSIDAMPSVLSGIPMMVEPFFLTPASMNALTGIAGELHNKNYHSAFFHGANNGSMGFEAFARATGYDRYYGRSEYGGEGFDASKDYDGMWAVWDEPFLQYMAATINTMPSPFFATVFTASSHHPFALPEQYEKVYPDEGGQPIHKCVRYSDMALRKFFESAEKQPWYKNTIFVLVADHTNLTSHPFYTTDQGLYSVPIIFYAPDGSLPTGIVDNVIAQQADVMPTVLSLLGYDKPFVAFGKDLLHATAENSWALNYNNGIYQYFKGDYLLQFNGTKSTALYAFKTDRMLQHNLLTATHGQQAHVVQQMEKEVKAIIQQYMTRMTQNALVVREK